MRNRHFKKGDTAYKVVEGANGYEIRPFYIYDAHTNESPDFQVLLVEEEWGGLDGGSIVYGNECFYKTRKQAQKALEERIAFLKDRDEKWANRASVQSNKKKFADAIERFDHLYHKKGLYKY